MEPTRITPEMQVPSSGKKEKNQNIQVFVRVRPINSLETSKNALVVVDTPGTKEVVVRERTVANITKTFTFDRVFGPRSKQIDVYKTVVSPLLSEVLLGYNCTVFAYGQTGTGKTFTMEGERSAKTGATIEGDINAGILPRALTQLFDEVRLMNCEFNIRVSFLELYNEELFDLLAPIDDSKTKTLRLFEDSNRKGSVIIQGLQEQIVNNKQEVYSILDCGSQQRKTAATLMNAHSSRSHTIFTITVHMKESSVEGEEMIKVGKLNLVDLAGSENIGKSGAVDKRAREAGSINQSLLTLGRVITALVDRTPHIPYRESKLTRLLQDSLGGKTKTSIIATVSPAALNIEETMSTLEYAHRAKNIMNKPEVNQKMTKKEALNIYTDEIERLRRDLNATRDKNGVYMDNDNYQRTITQIQAQHAELNEKSNRIRELEDLVAEKEQNELECAKLLEEMRMDMQIKQSMMEESQRKQETLHKKLLLEERRTDQLQYLVKYHMDTEEKMSGEATSLLNTAHDSVAVIEALHGRIERKQGIEDRNQVSAQRFREEFSKGMDELVAAIEQLREEHTLSVSSIRDIFDKGAGYRIKIVEIAKNYMDKIFQIVEEKHLDLITTCSAKMHTVIDAADELNVGFKDRIGGLDVLTKTHLKGFDNIVTNSKAMCLSIQAENQKLERSLSDRFGNMTSDVKHLLTANSKVFERVHQVVASMKRKFAEVNSVGQVGFETFRNDQNRYKVEMDAKLEKVEKELNYFKDAAERMQGALVQIKVDTEQQFGKSEKTFQHVVKEMAGLSSSMEDGGTEGCKQIQDAKQMGTNFSSKMDRFRDRLVNDHVNHLQSISGKAVQIEKDFMPKLSSTFQGSVQDMTNTVCMAYETVVSTKEKIQRDSTMILRDVDALVGDSFAHTKDLKEKAFELMKIYKSEDKKQMQEVISVLDKQCDDVSGDAKKIHTLLRQAAGNVDEFWDETYLLDSPSGGTPMARKYELPSTLCQPSPHSRVMSRYREVSNDVQTALDDCVNKEDLDFSWSDGYFKNLPTMTNTVFGSMTPFGGKSPSSARNAKNDDLENQNPNILATPTGSKQLESIEESVEPKDVERKSDVSCEPKEEEKSTPNEPVGQQPKRKSSEKKNKKKKKNVLKTSN